MPRLGGLDHNESVAGATHVRVVTLVSGGLDSTLMVALSLEQGLEPLPLFVDFGQLGREREFTACTENMKRLGIGPPAVAELGGFGRLLPSGITDASRDIVADAFLPLRNGMLLTVAAGYAFRNEARAIAIGLLDEAFSLFPDQTRDFVRDAEQYICRSLGTTVRVLAPLMRFSKADVVRAAGQRGIVGTYSCHAGGPTPCGQCIACREYIGVEG